MLILGLSLGMFDGRYDIRVSCPRIQFMVIKKLELGFEVKERDHQCEALLSSRTRLS